MEKSPDAFRNISEVAGDLDLPQHVLRFWETRFTQIKPLKRGGGRRYYRPEDVDLLRAIRHLLYDEGYTIKGVQRILKDHGARAVAQMALTQMGAAPAPAPSTGIAPAPASPARAPVAAPRDRDDGEADFFDFDPHPAPVQPSAPPPRSDLDVLRDAARPPGRAPLVAAPDARREPVLEVEAPLVDSPRAQTSPLALATPGARAMEIASTLKMPEIERLKAVLYELAECERLLAAARRA